MRVQLQTLLRVFLTLVKITIFCATSYLVATNDVIIGHLRTPIKALAIFDLVPLDVTNDSIHLIETYDDSALLLETLCIIESAARYNPKRQVFLHMTGKKLAVTQAVELLLASHPNIQFTSLDVKSLITQTAADLNVTLKNNFFTDLFGSPHKVRIYT